MSILPMGGFGDESATASIISMPSGGIGGQPEVV